jgi:excisionase family DNA binding protein
LNTLAAALPSPLPPLISVSRAAELLGISRSTGYDLARSGQLPGVTKLGVRFVVRTAVFGRWLDGQPDAQ